METVLSVKNLSYSYNEDKKALKGISLDIHRGERLAVIGSNGAGKSTLFNVISGTYYVDFGRILLDGRDVTYLPEYKRSAFIGHLFQDPLKGTAPHMTIEENLAVAYLHSSGKNRIFGRIKKADREFFRE